MKSRRALRYFVVAAVVVVVNLAALKLVVMDRGMLPSESLLMWIALQVGVYRFARGDASRRAFWGGFIVLGGLAGWSAMAGSAIATPSVQLAWSWYLSTAVGWLEPAFRMLESQAMQSRSRMATMSWVCLVAVLEMAIYFPPQLLVGVIGGLISRFGWSRWVGAGPVGEQKERVAF